MLFVPDILMLQCGNDLWFLLLFYQLAPQCRATIKLLLATRLQIGKSEMRRYTAVYMQKDTEVSPYSDDLVISCIP